MTEFETLDAILARRHSCRAFLSKDVPQADIERVLTTAQRVPSWCNAQPWQVTITAKTETEKLRDALYSYAQSAAQQSDIAFPESYEDVYRQRRSTCGWALYDAVGVAKGDRVGSTKQMMENFRLFGAPHLALITTEANLGPYGILDCGAYVTAFTLAAEALGIASIPQAALAGYSPFLRQWFDLPDNRQVVCGISFGYRDEDHPVNGFRTERAPLEDVVSWVGQAPIARTEPEASTG